MKIKIKKKPAASYSRTGESRTTLGDGALNFRVRNGNGCDNSSMATGKRDLRMEVRGPCAPAASAAKLRLELET